MSPDLVSQDIALPTPGLDPLRRQIGWLCHAIRLMAIAYPVWVIGTIVDLWLDKTDVIRRYGAWLKVDLSGIEAWQRVAGFSLHAIICVFIVAACWSVWRLASGFLKGRIFTPDAALWLRRAGSYGLIAEICDILARPAMSLVVTAHMPQGHRHIGIALNQNDLAFLMFLTALVALAHIFKKAADIAEENEGIV